MFKEKKMRMIDCFTLNEYPFDCAVTKIIVPFNFNDVYEQVLLERETTITNNHNFQKIEIRKPDSEILKSLLKYMQSIEIINALRDIFKIDDLTADPYFDGGGITISNVGAYLRYHHDFPYSNVTGKYRVVNALLYLSSDDIDGGDLHLLDPVSGTVEATIAPTWGTVVAFPTSKYTPHGFSRIRNGTRVGVNAYYYSNTPLDDRYEPQKTTWL